MTSRPPVLYYREEGTRWTYLSLKKKSDSKIEISRVKGIYFKIKTIQCLARHTQVGEAKVGQRVKH